MSSGLFEMKGSSVCCMPSLRTLRFLFAGIQGPVIVAQAGERVVVHFKNLASQPYSISPVGISYWKQSEGDLLHHTLNINQQHNVLVHFLTQRCDSESLSSSCESLAKYENPTVTV